MGGLAAAALGIGIGRKVSVRRRGQSDISQIDFRVGEIKRSGLEASPLKMSEPFLFTSFYYIYRIVKLL